VEVVNQIKEKLWTMRNGEKNITSRS
jgi:hypothetical protein